MKSSFALAFALVISGCSDIDLLGDETAEAPPPVSAQPLPPAVQQPASAAPAGDQSPAPEVQAAAVAAPAEGEPPAVSAARTAPAPNPAVSAHCSSLAKLRAGDAAFQGEDPDTQRAVHDKTYSDCLAWDSQHRS